MESDPKSERIKKGAETVGQSWKVDTKMDVSELMTEFMEKKSVPKEALDMRAQELEAVYGQAYRLYNTGKFKDAVDLFRLLIMAEPAESKYALGMAACFHMLKEFTNAVKAYSLYALMDTENPIPYFHQADCFIQMGDPIGAMIALETAVKRAGNKPQYQVLKDRSLMMIQSLDKEVEKKFSK